MGHPGKFRRALTPEDIEEHRGYCRALRRATPKLIAAKRAAAKGASLPPREIVTSQSNKFQAIKGVRDILPPESALWNRVEQTAREVFATYGYGEIRLPIFEQTELFARSIGGETDIVCKEMYTFATEYDRDSTRRKCAGADTQFTAGGDRFGGARLHRAWDADAAREHETLLHGADVSPRAAAEGALPAVLSDWRGAARHLRPSGAWMRK